MIRCKLSIYVGDESIYGFSSEANNELNAVVNILIMFVRGEHGITEHIRHGIFNQKDRGTNPRFVGFKLQLDEHEEMRGAVDVYRLLKDNCMRFSDPFVPGSVYSGMLNLLQDVQTIMNNLKEKPLEVKFEN